MYVHQKGGRYGSDGGSGRSSHMYFVNPAGMLVYISPWGQSTLEHDPGGRMGSMAAQVGERSHSSYLVALMLSASVGTI